MHGGLTQGLAPAMYEELIYDEHGTLLNGSFMDYLVPTAVESPNWETGHTITPSPHHPIGAKGVGESPTVGAPPAIANAIIDADEIDRTDEEFEAFLLELLSEFQISIPEVGTVKATYIPYVILTSNRTRELSDALKRRCLYHWVDYQSREKELSIVQKRYPNIEAKLANQLVFFIQNLRNKKLQKVPGISETLDWALSLMVLGYQTLDTEAVERTFGCILKSVDDIRNLREEGFSGLIL